MARAHTHPICNVIGLRANPPKILRQMAHLHCWRRARVWTRTRFPVLHRNREWGSRSKSLQYDHFLHSTMQPMGLESGSESVSESICVNVNIPYKSKAATKVTLTRPPMIGQVFHNTCFEAALITVTNSTKLSRNLPLNYGQRLAKIILQFQCLTFPQITLSIESKLY